MLYQNATFKELLSLKTDKKVIENFNIWNKRLNDKLLPYTIKLNNKKIKAYGELSFTDRQKSITYTPTYGNIISLEGKTLPRKISLNFILEYDYNLDNFKKIQQQAEDLKEAKKKRKKVLFEILEQNLSFNVTIEFLKTTYKGVRDIYISLELMEMEQ